MESKNGLESLLHFMREVDDPRSNRHLQYPLIELLFLTVSAVMSGASDWDEIVDFGTEKLNWLRGYLPYESGIPSHDTLNRTMGLINPRMFEKCFLNWVNMSISLPNGVLINIDGKKLRSSATKKEQQTAHSKGGKSAVHLVEAWCGAFQMCLAQYKVADKSNEIVAIPVILNWLELEGCIVSIDAIGCQKSIATCTIDKKADYILALKENQETLFLATTEYFDNMEEGHANKVAFDEQACQGHGRIEKRICRAVSVQELPQWAGVESWKGIKTVIEIYSERTIMSSGALSSEKRYYISSLSCDAKRFNQLIRSHWAIENQLHWSLDVQFGEDHDRKRSRNSAENFGLIRRVVLNLLKASTDKISIGRKMNKCALSDSYREKVFGGLPSKKKETGPKSIGEI